MEANVTDLNIRQQRVLDLMRARQDRDLYETAGANHKVGSGMYAVTYTGDEPRYAYLTQEEVDDLVRRGMIEERWPGCFKLFGAIRHDRKGRVIP